MHDFYQPPRSPLPPPPSLRRRLTLEDGHREPVGVGTRSMAVLFGRAGRLGTPAAARTRGGGGRVQALQRRETAG